MAHGKTEIDRCALKVAAGPRLKSSRALVFDGGELDVGHCWFQGFDKAIEVSALGGTVARIQQTMIVPAAGLAPSLAQSPEMHGWGVKVQLAPGGGPQRHLILEHCTVEGAGLLDLASSSPALTPLRVEVQHCALRAEALLAWKPNKPGDPLMAQIQWLGKGNQYDVLGRSWIVLSASQGTPAFSITVTDLESWLRVASNESDPIRAKLRFRIDSRARSGPLEPPDFEIEASGSPQTKPGADPEEVGPGAR
jgi:hypothetical protein